MKATFGDSEVRQDLRRPTSPAARRWRTTPTPTGSRTARTSRRRKALFQEAGYDGQPIVLLQATNIPYMNNSAQILAQELRRLGFNVQVVSMDWSGVVQRRANRNPPDQGGWNIFLTSAGGSGIGNPILLAAHAATGDKAWFGWPSDEKHEELRNDWALAETLDERKAIARELQENAWNFVPHLYYGQWIQPAAMRSNIRGLAAGGGDHPVVERREDLRHAIAPRRGFRPARDASPRDGRSRMIAYIVRRLLVDHPGDGRGRDLRVPAAAPRARRSGRDHRRRQRDAGHRSRRSARSSGSTSRCGSSSRSGSAACCRAISATRCSGATRCSP